MKHHCFGDLATILVAPPDGWNNDHWLGPRYLSLVCYQSTLTHLLLNSNFCLMDITLLSKTFIPLTPNLYSLKLRKVFSSLEKSWFIKLLSSEDLFSQSGQLLHFAEFEENMWVVIFYIYRELKILTDIQQYVIIDFQHWKHLFEWVLNFQVTPPYVGYLLWLPPMLRISSHGSWGCQLQSHLTIFQCKLGNLVNIVPGYQFFKWAFP